MSFPTPSFAHLKQVDYQHVYEPAEDTFLMMDALEKDVNFLKERRYGTPEPFLNTKKNNLRFQTAPQEGTAQ